MGGHNKGVWRKERKSERDRVIEKERKDERGRRRRQRLPLQKKNEQRVKSNRGGMRSACLGKKGGDWEWA